MVDQNTPAGNLWRTEQVRNDWRVYLTELDNSPKENVEAVETIRQAGPEDTVEILITCPGGAVDVADMYLAAIRDSQAKVITRAIGECASAATTVFLAGEERICEDGCYFMFHNVQLGMSGDSANVYSRSRFYEQHFKSKFYGMLSEVLSPGELETLFENAGEIYLTAEDMRSRLESSLKKSKEEDKSAEQKLVDFPFPKQIPPEYNCWGEEVTICTRSGHKKTFARRIVKPSDFEEFSLEGLKDVADIFSIDTRTLPYSRAVDAIVDKIKSGGLA